MPIEAVVFDMDGLLLDTEAIDKVAWQQAATDRDVMAALIDRR